MFVGRARELEELERVLDATQAGRGATVLVAGEAGIGKTRLAAEVATRARGRGFAVLIGRSIDLVGSELPYQPFVEALGPLPREAGSQLRVFETALALLADRAEPVLLVLEDVHWADTSTLDLAVFLAHNVADEQVVLLATYRDGETVRRFAESAKRSGSALTLELGPLAHADLIALLADAPDAPAIATRSGGNPFFAEELLAAGGELPESLRELLLRRVRRLDGETQELLRVIAAAGRDVGHPLLRTADRDSLRQAVDHGVLVADQDAGTIGFRHALLAEAVYSTILPGEREELHGRLAEELARTGAAAAELAPHWAAAGRSTEALAASVAAAHDAEAVFGLTEALAHLERAIALWPEVPDAPDLADLCHRAAELAWQTGGALRAAELARRAIELVGESDRLRAARLQDGLGRYLHAAGESDAGIAALERAVALVPAEPPSPEFAQALATLGNGLISSWRFDESRVMCSRALVAARAVGSQYAEFLAVRGHGAALAYLGQGEDGLAQAWAALELAKDPLTQELAYGTLTDVLTMLGRPREAARLAATALEELQPYGIDRTTLVANRVEALVAIGEWDEAEAVSAAALRAMTANYPRYTLIFRASLETGRGDFDAARAHLDEAVATVHEDAEAAICDAYACELALWERRWTDADAAIRRGVARARGHETAQIRVWLCAKGLRAQAELAALARARRDVAAAADRRGRAALLLATARQAAAEASAVTPNAGGWLALAEAEFERARPDLWSAAADAWERLERPPLAAYCRWRQAEALVAAGAARAEATAPLRAAHAVATRLHARPLLRELELLATRARLDPSPPPQPAAAEPILGLTPRETEVLTLVAHGLTNREIADELVISVKTASVHVSHILRKLDAPNRREAAAIAHRLENAERPAGWRAADGEAERPAGWRAARGDSS
jgi:DNA-binding CsgD family transcriptional regulator/tetratricopeptide (TPR) repeat protein